MNTYGYVYANPLTYFDPDGLQVVKAPKGTGEKGPTYYPWNKKYWEKDPPNADEFCPEPPKWKMSCDKQPNFATCMACCTTVGGQIATGGIGSICHDKCMQKFDQY